MKNLNRPIAFSKKTTALAVLSAVNTAVDPVAILAAEIKTNEQGLVQLLPAGRFSAVDGRPKDVAGNQWLMDQIAFEQLKANTPHQIGDLVIDYEHQTLKAETNGQPAIASGYFNIDDVQFIEGKGLFVKPRWTDKAQAHLAAGEYKYISAVFGYDRQTGRPLFLHSAGLVNRPGVDGMEPLAQLAAQQHVQHSTKHNSTQNNSTQQEESAVNEILLAILKALGINVDGELPTDATALKAYESKVITALSALQANADKVDGLNQQIVALSAGDGDVDPSKYVPIAAVSELQKTVAALQAQVTGGEVDNLVSQGVKDGKIIAVMKDWARDLGNKNVADLKAYLDKTPAIAALKGKQSNDTNLDNNDENDVAALSADDKVAANLLGMSHDDFAKQKAADKGAK